MIQSDRLTPPNQATDDPDDEFPVTGDMIEAGAEAFLVWEGQIKVGRSYPRHKMLAAVYRAMRLARNIDQKD
jgi:hypothetical protein